jgi:23S rRNA (uracil1939-C5)-methyltransferase/tRNA (uracil-5-)-methyltransferase
VISGDDDEAVELTVEGLDPRGRGVAAGAGGVRAHVPFVLPGERIRARVWRGTAGAAAEGDLLEVISPSPDRVPPGCPLYGTCGGCQLQHLAYDRQLGWKTDTVRAQLGPLGLADRVAPCVGSPRAYGYRSKITPHHRRPRPDRPLRIGFLRAGRRHEVIDVERCPLATDGINARLPALRAEAAARAATRPRGVTLLLRETASGVTTDPDARVVETVGDLALGFFAREFFQNNPFLLPALVEAVVDAAASGGAPALVDTYSGSGLFALAAARRFADVVGVEVSPAAVAAARENAARNGLGHVHFVAADAARIFAGLPRAGADSAVIVDPPRAGCGAPFLEQLVAFAPRTVVYVSCNPEALARDLGALAASGYAVREVQPFDMFPQTRHIECVAVLDRCPDGRPRDGGDGQAPANPPREPGVPA